ncbi:MAG: hypothetical protein MUQ59_00520, partial [Loktanella sp.]|nr:hypothetical protein [Loktanella sp.]
MQFKVSRLCLETRDFADQVLQQIVRMTGFPPPRSGKNYAHAAIFVLRAHAAGKPNSHNGL